MELYLAICSWLVIVAFALDLLITPKMIADKVESKVEYADFIWEIIKAAAIVPLALFYLGFI